MDPRSLAHVLREDHLAPFVDADEGLHAGSPTSAGHAVLIVTPPDEREECECYLTIHFKWSRRDGSSLVVPANLPYVTPPQQ